MQSNNQQKSAPEAQKRFFINIGREFCSGGLSISEQLSKRFGIPYYDKELLNMASAKSGISHEFFANADEKPNRFKPIFSGLPGISSVIGFANYNSECIIGGDSLFNIQSEVIREIAEQGSAIFVGRCADYILRDFPNILNVFIYADMEQRVENARATERFSSTPDMTDRQIAEQLRKFDKKRAEYYNYYTVKRWGEKESYHLCINVSKVGEDFAVEMIAAAAKKIFSLE